MKKLYNYLRSVFRYKVLGRINPIQLIEENKEEIKRECSAVSVEKKKRENIWQKGLWKLMEKKFGLE
jgi:hypothetical protein